MVYGQPTRRSLLASTGAVAVGLTLNGLVSGCTKSQGAHLNFYNWDTYIGDTTLADFMAATGVEVQMSLFANNDELFAKLRGGNQGYDVIVPSNDFVERMIQADMLELLDHRLIPNARNIAPAFRDVNFDPGRRFSMPYTWLVIGIGYRKSVFPGFVPDSWKWVFESDKYKGRIGLVAESGNLFRLVYKYLGFPMNSTDLAHVQAATELLIKQKPNILLFHDDDGQNLLEAGDIDIVIEYNGDVAQVMREDHDLDFIVPHEGSELTSDCLCIPKGAPNAILAHKFINFMLDGQVGADITKAIQYPSPNQAAVALLGTDYSHNPAIFPPKEILAKCDYAHYLGDSFTHVIEDAMTKVRAA